MTHYSRASPSQSRAASVSRGAAMRIGLEKLGLLLRTEPKQHSMKGVL